MYANKFISSISELKLSLFQSGLKFAESEMSEYLLFKRVR